MPEHNEVLAFLKELKADQDERHKENVTSIHVTEQKVDEALRRIDDLHKAFPGGDWEGHRRYHEAMIEKIEKRAQFYQAMIEEVAKKGLWALVMLIISAIIFTAKAKFK